MALAIIALVMLGALIVSWLMLPASAEDHTVHSAEVTGAPKKHTA